MTSAAIPGRRIPAVGQTHPRRRQGRHLADRLLERQQLLVAHVSPEDPRRRAPRAGVRLLLRERSRPRPAPRSRCPSRRAGGREPSRTSSSLIENVTRPDVRAVRDHQIHESVERILLFGARDLGDRLPLVLLQLGVQNRGDQDSRSRLVAPVRVFLREVGASAGPGRRGPAVAREACRARPRAPRAAGWRRGCSSWRPTGTCRPRRRAPRPAPSRSAASTAGMRPQLRFPAVFRW